VWYSLSEHQHTWSSRDVLKKGWCFAGSAGSRRRLAPWILVLHLRRQGQKQGWGRQVVHRCFLLLCAVNVAGYEQRQVSNLKNTKVAEKCCGIHSMKCACMFAVAAFQFSSSIWNVSCNVHERQTEVFIRRVSVYFGVCVCVFSLFLQLQTTFQMPFMYELLCLKLWRSKPKVM